MDKYRVIVLREGATEDETLFEIAGPARRVMRIAPGAVLEAMDEDQRERAEGEPERSVADRVFDSAVAAGGAGSEQPDQAETPKRKRRTKAEIEADNAAVAAGFRDAAHQAEAGQQPAAAAPPAADPAIETPAPPRGPFNPFQQ